MSARIDERKQRHRRRYWQKDPPSERGEDSTMSGNHEDVMKAAVAERLRAAMKQRRARGLDR